MPGIAAISPMRSDSRMSRNSAVFSSSMESTKP